MTILIDVILQSFLYIHDVNDHCHFHVVWRVTSEKHFLLDKPLEEKVHGC